MVITLTGRNIPNPPIIRLDSDRKAAADLRKHNAWLIAQGVAEAKARGDDYNLRWIEREVPNNLPQASKDCICQYLFGDNFPDLQEAY